MTWIKLNLVKYECLILQLGDNKSLIFLTSGEKLEISLAFIFNAGKILQSNKRKFLRIKFEHIMDIIKRKTKEGNRLS